MLILVSTNIDGQDRKKKLTIDENSSMDEIKTAIEKLFSGEPSLKGLKRLEWLDPDFKEFVDCDDDTTLKDKSVLKAYFNGSSVAGGHGSDEKDKIIDQLRNRLQQVEANMRLVSARNTSSETQSQRSAASELRRIKKEEKCCAVADQSRTDDSVSQQRRDDVREERRRLKRQELLAGMPC
eukprot:TRINITY_DN649_c1_g1_i1.p1 TRINITY_DN649_c1_g1~~TRINITY_DN649_c1_g1_i1.p1  ORF type:complete len:181 (+),score=45.54 TRINITY_DN649_c1_g1_i1:89-631(+)